MNLSKGSWALVVAIGALMIVATVTAKPTATGGRSRRTNIVYAVLIAALVVFGLTVGKDLGT